MGVSPCFMSDSVAASLESVKPPSVTLACRAGYTSVVSQLAERLQEILKARKLSARQLGRLAGMRTPSQLANTMSRLENDPDAVELKTLRRIADAAGVNWEWLLIGKGPRDTETVTVLDDPFPERTAALTPFRESLDPAHQYAARVLTAAGFKGTHAWTRERWTTAFLHYANEYREDTKDPTRRERIDRESDETIKREHLNRPSLEERIERRKSTKPK
jgi:transcriptional regulator with XRE-family HTH domain